MKKYVDAYLNAHINANSGNDNMCIIMHNRMHT